jgi:exo-beta-1,3-glucanase (GH17 family)
MNKPSILALLSFGSCLVMTSCAVFLTINGYPTQGSLIAAAIPSVNYRLLLVKNHRNSNTSDT